MTDAVVDANAEFYAAFESGDLDRMQAAWDEGDVVCVHPGWPMLRGRDQVLRSWALIMANTSYIQFFLTDVTSDETSDVAVVTCTENILMGEEEAPGMQAARVAATNVFRNRDGRWLLTVHHGSPVLGDGPQDIG